MCVGQRKTCWRVQTFQISEMAAIDEVVNGGMSFVNTVMRQLLHDLEDDYNSDLWYCDDR